MEQQRTRLSGDGSLCTSHLPDPDTGGCVVHGANVFTFIADPNGLNLLFGADLAVEVHQLPAGGVCSGASGRRKPMIPAPDGGVQPAQVRASSR